MRQTPTRILNPTIYKGDDAMIILYVLPVCAIACGLICRKGGFKGTYCLLTTVFLSLFVFFFRGASFTTAEAAYNAAALLSPEELGSESFPVGLLFLAKPFSILNLGSDVFAVTVLTLISLGFGYFIYSFCNNPTVGAVTFIALGFPFIITEDISPAIAVLIAGFGLKYTEKRQFFRCCGYMLLASCFSPSVLLLIPLYFLLLPDNPIIEWVLSIAAAALIFLPFKDKLFGFLNCSEVPKGAGLPIYFSAVIIVFAIIFTLMSKMIRLSGSKGYRFLGAIIMGAALSAAAVLDGRLIYLFVALTVPSVTVLSSKAVPILLTLLLKTFPENKKAAYITAVSVFSVMALILFTLALFSGTFTLPALSIT